MDPLNYVPTVQALDQSTLSWPGSGRAGGPAPPKLRHEHLDADSYVGSAAASFLPRVSGSLPGSQSSPLIGVLTAKGTDMSFPARHQMKRLAYRLLGVATDNKHAMLATAFSAANSWRVEGDYLEFGVYRGRTFIEAFKQAERISRKQMRFYAFDSFEGLPQPNTTEGGSKFHAGQYACSHEEFLAVLEAHNVDSERVHCIKGFYSESLTRELQRSLASMKAAVIWIDCDLYKSALDALMFSTPFVQTGTIICFDDWFSFGGHPEKGEIRAVNEWLEQNDHIRLTMYRNFGVSGRSFVAQNLAK